MSDNKTNNRKKALKEFLIGAGFAALGGIATFASYNSARPGGTYTVYTGIIVLGAVYAIKGLFGLIFPNAFKKKSAGNNPKASAEALEEADEADVVKDTDASK